MVQNDVQKINTGVLRCAQDDGITIFGCENRMALRVVEEVGEAVGGCGCGAADQRGLKS